MDSWSSRCPLYSQLPLIPASLTCFIVCWMATHSHPSLTVREALSLSGASMGPVWGQHGTSVEPAWGQCSPEQGQQEASTGPANNQHGARMEPAQDQHWTTMEPELVQHIMGTARGQHGTSMGLCVFPFIRRHRHAIVSMSTYYCVTDFVSFL